MMFTKYSVCVCVCVSVHIHAEYKRPEHFLQSVFNLHMSPTSQQRYLIFQL